MLAVAEQNEFESKLIPRVATGFCSGMARTGGMCGAVTGGILAIGLVLGRSSPEQPVEPCYLAVRELMQRFNEQFGSLNCAELTGVQLGTPEGQAAFKEKGQFEECAKYVGGATKFVIEIIAV